VSFLTLFFPLTPALPLLGRGKRKEEKNAKLLEKGDWIPLSPPFPWSFAPIPSPLPSPFYLIPSPLPGEKARMRGVLLTLPLSPRGRGR